jgi:hypothetical protein
VIGRPAATAELAQPSTAAARVKVRNNMQR